MAPQYYDMANFPMCEAKRQLERIIAKLQSGKGGNLWSQDIPGSTTCFMFCQIFTFCQPCIVIFSLSFLSPVSIGSGGILFDK